MLNVLFFASLKEQLNCERLPIEHQAHWQTVDDLRCFLQSRDETWQQVLDNPSLLMAVNQDMARKNTPIHDGDEIAFFPPVTGG